MSASFRKQLGIPGLIRTVYHHFSKIPDPRQFGKNDFISLNDHLMSGLAVFGLKCPSLLDYDRKRKDQATEHNLRDLYHVVTPPSDTYLRERLDEVDPDNIRPAFKKLFASFQSMCSSLSMEQDIFHPIMFPAPTAAKRIAEMEGLATIIKC